MAEEKRKVGRPKGSFGVKKQRNKKSLHDLFHTSAERYTEISINKARRIAARILEDELYLTNLIRRARVGVLAPAMEMMLWYYLFGKPVEKIQVSTTDDSLIDLTDAELSARTKELHEITLQMEAKNHNDKLTSEAMN